MMQRQGEPFPSQADAFSLRFIHFLL